MEAGVEAEAAVGWTWLLTSPSSPLENRRVPKPVRAETVAVVEIEVPRSQALAATATIVSGLAPPGDHPQSTDAAAREAASATAATHYTTTQTLLEAGIFGFLRRAKPSAAA